MNKHFEPYCHSTSQCKWTLYLSESVLNKYFSRWNEEDHWGRSQEVKTGWLVESRGNSWRRSVTGSGCIATAAWSSSLWCSALTVIVTTSELMHVVDKQTDSFISYCLFVMQMTQSMVCGVQSVKSLSFYPFIAWHCWLDAGKGIRTAIYWGSFGEIFKGPSEDYLE